MSDLKLYLIYNLMNKINLNSRRAWML